MTAQMPQHTVNPLWEAGDHFNTLITCVSKKHDHPQLRGRTMPTLEPFRSPCCRQMEFACSHIRVPRQGAGWRRRRGCSAHEFAINLTLKSYSLARPSEP